jgi:hypothetical protein
MTDASLSTASAVFGATSDCQARVGVFPLAAGRVLVLSDAAAGSAGGRKATSMVIGFFRRRAGEFQSFGGSYGWILALSELDRLLTEDSIAGEASAAIAFVADGTIHGASVGNARIWHVTPDGIADLTERQRAHPPLGSRVAIPVGFGPVALTGRLLLGSHGLFDHGDRETIARIARTEAVTDAPAKLVNAVRSSSGELIDDVAVIVCGGALDRAGAPDPGV